ncbi:hypothetical protein B7P43_G13420 [Cryptotermes secundus]|uniref:Uncharacterized protein n=1 Tax=Cryptotermes secundus TaxID=105785 RepID=A0A2J7QP86_9NEOP|nr:hypothetical protein B7P43_G13420 [Cryptotermes secundus]
MRYYVVGNNVSISRLTVYNPETWVVKTSWSYVAGVHILSLGGGEEGAMLNQLV